MNVIKCSDFISNKGLGTDEDVLVEILATRSNHEIREIKKVFKEGLIWCSTISLHKFLDNTVVTQSWRLQTLNITSIMSEYNSELEEVIVDETSGDFTKALLAMLKADKDESEEVDKDQARKDAKVQVRKISFLFSAKCMTKQKCLSFVPNEPTSFFKTQ